MPENNKNIKVLVTGVGGPAGINISRLLQPIAGVEVVGCDIDSLAAGQFFTDSFLLCPKVSDTAAYRKWLEETISKEDIDVLIPTVDEELLPLSEFVESLNVFSVLSNTATLAVAADKLKSYTFMKESLPELTAQFVPLADWSPGWSNQETFFIKPRQGRGARGCRVVDSKELAFLAQDSLNGERLIVMENLNGTEWTVDAYVSRAGKVVYLVPRERVALSGGISTKGKTVLNQQVIDATTALLEKLPCVGPVCVQWKMNAQGELKFVEINPRLSGGLMISVAAGVNPAEAIIAEYKKQTPEVQEWSEATVVGYTHYKPLT